jgi:hypothetical protein
MRNIGKIFDGLYFNTQSWSNYAHNSLFMPPVIVNKNVSLYSHDFLFARVRERLIARVTDVRTITVCVAVVCNIRSRTTVIFIAYPLEVTTSE